MISNYATFPVHKYWDRRYGRVDKGYVVLGIGRNRVRKSTGRLLPRDYSMGENGDVRIDYLAYCGVVETVVLKVSQSPAGDVCLGVIHVSENH